MQLQTLTDYLDEYLQIREIPDYKGAYNGLQVTGKSPVDLVLVAVDACQATIDHAAKTGAGLVIVHHGLFWGGSAPVVNVYYRRLAGLIKNDIGLYSCHLPLDAHPEVGNNHVLTRSLGLTPGEQFGEFEGTAIGVTAETNIPLEAFVRLVQRSTGAEPFVIATGPSIVRNVGILTGGGGSLIGQAVAAGIDTYLTGEGAHHTYFDAEENGINVIYAGHYATETFGVRALGDHLTAKFGLPVAFFDHPTGL